MGSGFMVKSLLGLGFGCRVPSSGDQGFRFRVQGSSCKVPEVLGLGFRNSDVW